MVWDEAAKDASSVARRAPRIARSAAAWLARAPAKVAATFDYFGAAPWYLHLANAEAFGERAKWRLGARRDARRVGFTLLFALVAVAPPTVPRRRRASRRAVAGVALACVARVVGYVALALAILALGPRALAGAPLVVPASGARPPRHRRDPRGLLRRRALRARRRTLRHRARVRAAAPGARCRRSSVNRPRLASSASFSARGRIRSSVSDAADAFTASALYW